MNVVVLGMHRSGTSLASGLLHRAGVFFGESTELIKANDENPKGFWERSDFRRLNDRLLHAQHADWNEIARVDQHAIDEDTLAAFNDDARQILDDMRQRASNGIIGIKEPRHCLLLDQWAPVLGDESFYLLVHRDPEEIAISLNSRDPIPPAVANYLTEQYLGRALRFLAGKPCAIVSYEEMLNEPLKTSQRLVKAINEWSAAQGSDLRLKRPEPSDVKGLASKALYRSRSEGTPYPAHARLKQWRKALKKGELPGVRSVANRPSTEVLSYQYEQRFAAFKKVRGELENRKQRVNTLERQVQSNIEFDRKVKELSAKLSDARSEQREALQQQDKLAKALAKETEQRQEVSSQRTQLEESLEGARSQRLEALNQIEEQQEALRVSTEQGQQAERQLEKLAAELKTAQEQQLGAQQQLENLEKALGAARLAQDKAQREGKVALDQAREREQTLAEQVKTTRQALERAETLASRQSEQIGTLQTSVKSAENTISELGGQVEALEAARAADRAMANEQAERLANREEELKALRKAHAKLKRALTQKTSELQRSEVNAEEIETLLRSAQADLEETTQERLLGEKQLSAALARISLLDSHLQKLIRQSAKDVRSLELADNLALSMTELRDSRSWKLLNPALSVLLRGASMGKPSKTLIELESRLEDFKGVIEARKQQQGIVEGVPPIATTQPAERKIPATALVVTWDVGHNPVGRSYMLAEVLQRVFRNVVIVGFQFDRFGKQLWEPLRNSRIPVFTIPGKNFPEYIDQLEELAERVDPDIVFSCKSRLPSLQLGALIKRRLNCPLVLDIDDHEMTFFPEDREIPPQELEQMELGSASKALAPYDGFWTGVAQGARGLADAILVSNPALEEEFGGTIIPHVRDELEFDPQFFSRNLVRHEFGVPLDAKVVLFFGTPRRHKGIELIAKTVAALDDKRARLVVVGRVPDQGDMRRLQTQAGDRLITIGNQPFHRIPAILSMADAVCLPQDPAHPTCTFQLPAKAIDAISMGVPLLVTATPPLKPLIEKGLAVEVDEHNILEKLAAVLSGSATSRHSAEELRKAFEAHYSYAAAAKTLRSLAQRLLRQKTDQGDFENRLGSFLKAQQKVLGTAAVRSKSDSSEGQDVVLFWKQNDSGLYGRRVDMFIKQLEARPGVRRVIVFDAPISEYDLLKYRDDEGKTSQHRMIYENTYDKLLGKLDRPRVSYNVFLHPPGIYDLPGRSTPGRRPLVDGYLPFIERVLAREGCDASQALFVLYPKNFVGREIVEHFAPQKVLVDVVDDHREWPGTTPEQYELLTRNYEELLKLADMAFVNCAPMLEKMAPMADNLRLVENGCDPDAPVSTPDGNASFAELESWRGQVIGFVGNMESKIDMGLIRQTAQRFPTARIVLVGSTHTNRKARELEQLDNVVMPGVVPYDQVGAWIKRFDVAIVPHIHTGMTENMNPLKIYVYLQWGVPVVSTDIPNIGYKGDLLRVAEDSESFLQAISDTLDNPPRNRKAERDRFVAENSWSARFEGHLDELLGAPGAAQETSDKRPQAKLSKTRKT